VVFFTDGAESSDNCIVIGESARIPLDECFGSLNQQMTLQWITDPFWQRPHRPCDLDGGTAWREDDGSGNEDGPCPEDVDTDCAWYPQRPFVEAILSVPGGAPALPAGVNLVYLTVDDINDGLTEVDGIMVNAPQQGSCWFPWWRYQLNREGTILSEGRFAPSYNDPTGANGLDPDDTALSPP
jgi:hypothetical protein